MPQTTDTHNPQGRPQPTVADFYVELLAHLPAFDEAWRKLGPYAEMEHASLLGFLNFGWVMGCWMPTTAARWLIAACQSKGLAEADMRTLVTDLHDRMREAQWVHDHPDPDFDDDDDDEGNDEDDVLAVQGFERVERQCQTCDRRFDVPYAAGSQAPPPDRWTCPDCLTSHQ